MAWPRASPTDALPPGCPSLRIMLCLLLPLLLPAPSFLRAPLISFPVRLSLTLPPFSRPWQMTEMEPADMLASRASGLVVGKWVNSRMLVATRPATGLAVALDWRDLALAIKEAQSVEAWGATMVDEPYHPRHDKEVIPFSKIWIVLIDWFHNMTQVLAGSPHCFLPGAQRVIQIVC